jgi:glycosyltransferase involved in cell wall biosynthesis
MSDHSTMPPLAVSVVIPTFNRAHLVPRAIRSALESLDREDEIIVVDDGSTDGTASVVEAFGDPVRLLQRPHAGAGPTRNAGVAAASRPLLALLDSDDEWFPDKIRLQRRFLENRQDLVYAFSDFGVRMEDGTERRRYLCNWLPKPRPIPQVLGHPGVPYSSIAQLPAGRDDFDVYIGSMYLAVMRRNIVPTFTLMARREPAGKALLFPGDQATGEDWEAYGRLAGCGPGAFFDTETAWQHGHAGDRLTKLPSYQMAEAWLSALNRVWGQDEEFLSENQRSFQQAMVEANLMKARSLAGNGHGARAAMALRAAGLGAVSARAFEWLTGMLGHSSTPS